MTTKTVIISKPYQVMLQEESLPERTSQTFRVRTLVTAISIGTEMTAYTGDFPPESAWARYLRYPFPAGYSNLGEVIEVGTEVKEVQVGDRIAGYRPHTQLTHYHCKEFWLKVPLGISDEIAATFSLALIALNGVRKAQITLGEKVILFGLGPIGLLAGQFARLSGARPVIGVDLFSERRVLAKKVGFDFTLDGNQESLAETIAQLTQGRLADVVFEVTGNPQVIPKEFQVLRRQGRLVVLSSPRGPTLFDFHDLCNAPSYTIIGAHNSSHPPYETPDHPWTMSRNGELFFDLVERGELKIQELITHRFRWDQASEAYQLLHQDRGKTGIVLLDWRE